MRLQTLKAGRWKVLAPIDASGQCEVFDALRALAANPKTTATAAGFFVYFGQIPPEGPSRLGVDVYHPATTSKKKKGKGKNESKIFRFRKRDHRVYCFEDEGAVVICSHVALKQGDKTKKADLTKAESVRAAYFAAKKKGDLEIEPEERAL